MVVDVGSGSGFDSLIASTMVGPSGKVVGIDMTAEQHSIFERVPKPTSALEFGTRGIRLRARKSKQAK